MKYFKTFENQDLLSSYDKSEWISPHIYLNRQNKSLDYEQKYIQLEYIRSTETGGQYIDLGTGLFDTSPINFRIDMNYMIYGHGKTGKQQSTLLCASKEVSPWPGTNIRIDAKNDLNDLAFNFAVKEDQIDPKTGNRYSWCYLSDGRYFITVYGVDGKLYRGQYSSLNIKDVLLHTDRELNFTDGQLHNVTTTLFCSKDGSGTPWRFINARIDYLKLYKNGIIQHDLIPVKRLDGVVGLYDKSNRIFYQSQGDEPFIAGPVKQ